jgi:endonuclease/exonuclease/phosphatase family metal-dependent hydrolase
MSYRILRGRWCHIVVLNVHAPTEDKTDDVKDSFWEELDREFDKFPKYHMQILLGDFNAKEGREDIFKPTIGNESLHEISNDNGVKSQKYDVPTSQHSKYIWKCPVEKTNNHIDHILVGEGIRIYLMFDHTGQQIVILATPLSGGGKSLRATSSEYTKITQISYGEVQSQEVT